MKLSFILLAGGVASATTLCDLCGPTASAATLTSPAAGHELARAPISPAAVVDDTVTLKIRGMTCAGCTIATRRVLERLEGVTSANVSYKRKTAVVTYDPAVVTTRQMIEAVATLKYTATVVR